MEAMRTTILLLCILCLTACASDEPSKPIPPPGHTSAILDDEGAILILRGINVESAAKGAEDRSASPSRSSRWPTASA